MGKFRKKAVVIDAVQFETSGHPTHEGNQIEVMGATLTYRSQRGTMDAPGWYVQTLEGSLRVSNGDWIIREVKGEFYPCKPDIFQATYEPAY